MRNYRTVVIVLILVGVLSVPAQAQVIPGRWEKVEALSTPTIIAELKNGNRIEGKFDGLFPSELSLITHAAQAKIPRADIERITTRGPDSLANGTLIAAGAGAGLGLAGIVAAGGWGGEDFGAYASGFSLIGAGIGALVGLGIDAIDRKEVVLYQAP